MGEARIRRDKERLIKSAWPPELTGLHDGEELLRNEAILFIVGSDDLKFQMQTIKKSMNLLNVYFSSHDTTDEDELVIQHLAIRCFNASASCIKLFCGGYGQAAAALQRDLLETAFLISMFKTDNSLIKEWREISEEKRNSKFGPRVVREFLDKRDGFETRKRKDAYDALCRMGAHPTMQGFALLRGPDGLAPCGPFISFPIISAVVNELALIMVQVAGNFSYFIPNELPDIIRGKIEWFEASGRWFERFYNQEYDPALVNRLKEILSSAKNKREST